jgi:hypothetical protein
VTRPLDPATADEVRSRVETLRARIAAAAARAGRPADDVTLVGAAKRQPIERVAAAVAAGVTHLGHNYVQEAQAMRAELDARLAELPPGGDPPRLRWRMIGHLQSNKAGAAVGCFDAIDAVDSAKLARALDRRAGDAGRRLALGIQVNLSGEAQKSGLAEGDVPELLAACADLEHVEVTSLMTMPAAAEDPETTRPVFARLRALRDALRTAPGGAKLEGLSMGMSGDFEIAVEEGATLVRVGTALFGERAPR